MEITRKISLKCEVCGNTNFEYDDTLYSSIEEAEQVKCTVCNKVYSLEELKKANSILINNSIEELAGEAMEKQLKQLGIKFTKK